MDNLPDPGNVNIHDLYLNDMKAINALAESRLNQKKQDIENMYAPQKNEADIASKNALTRKTNIDSDWAPKLNQASLNNTNSLLNQRDFELHNPLINSSGLGGDIERMEYVRKKYGEKSPQYQMTQQMYKANLANEQAKANYYSMGAGRGGVANADEQAYYQAVKESNPQLQTEEQIREAADVYANRGNALRDGTSLAPITPTVQRRLDNAVKHTTTSGLITRGVQANAGEAELAALNRRALEGIKLAGTTYLGKSPEAIIDSFKSDDASQIRLGKIIGGNALQYAIAQIRNRIDMGEPGITATHEIMQNSGQLLDAAGGSRLTAKAREEAMKVISQATSEALSARNQYGIGASSATGKGDKPVSQNKYTAEDIRHTAEKYGISEEEVKRRVGI